MTTQTERERAFEAFYVRHYPAVLAYAQRRIDASTARDVVAETFLVAWRHYDRAAVGGLPWLYRTAALTLQNVDRGQRRFARTVGRLAGQPGGEREPDPAGSVVDRDEAVQALRRLSTADRELLLLVAWEQLDTRAAAQVLGCSAATAAVRLYRARRRLTAQLEQDAADHPAPRSLPEADR